MMNAKREIDYSLTTLSAFGAYPFHLLLILLFLKLEQFDSALFLTIGFFSMYVIGYPLRHVTSHYCNQDLHETSLWRTSCFPSYHATRVTFLGLFFANWFQYEHDVTLLLLFIIVCILISRIRYGHHTVLDVAGGILLGITLYVLASLSFNP
jgi:membrane-associated phospholipid phosphatase